MAVNKGMIENEWTPEHFVIYLYLCIANADYNMADEELETLHDKFDGLDIESNYGTVIKDVMHEYKNHTDYETMQFISDYSDKFCQDDAKKEKILDDLKDIIEADGIVKDVETIMFRNIKKMLNV